MPIVILDFDHTLFNAIAFKKDLASALNLTAKQWEKEYQKNKAKYKNYNYQAQLKKYPDDKQKKFLKILANCQKYLYPDATLFLKKIKKHKLILLSKGHASWQRIKIKNCHLEKKITVKTTAQSKINFIKKLKNQNSIIFINDRGKEIDEIKKVFPQITAIWVRRRNGQYKNESCKNFDYKTSNLKIKI